jgi:NAD(P)-dependent dehydrogenase (short-subunit alcohol dehydrogenase family)
MMDVSGKKALVFGGTSGIGLATVERLVAKGAKVIAMGRSPDKASDLPAGATFRQVDVTDRDAMDALFKEEAPFDILVSAATGGARAAGPFLQMDLDGYQGSFAKLWGYANVLRYGCEHLSANGAAVLVSGAPARKAKPGQVAISSVGGAVEALVRAVAPEIAPKRLNLVSPGTIDTPMFGPDDDNRKKFVAGATAGNLIPRAGEPDECAQAIMLVIENEFMTGTTVDVDGGWLLS